MTVPSVASLLDQLPDGEMQIFAGHHWRTGQVDSLTTAGSSADFRPGRGQQVSTSSRSVKLPGAHFGVHADPTANARSDTIVGAVQAMVLAAAARLSSDRRSVGFDGSPAALRPTS